MNAELANFADTVVYATVPIVELEALADRLFRIRFACPQMARSICPGQFLMVRIHGVDDPLIGRPLAMFDTDAAREAVDVVFVVGGNMTRRLAQLSVGDLLDVWGPLGNGFSMRSVPHVVLVAGGIGYTPFLATAKSYLGLKAYGDLAAGERRAQRVTFCFGARSKDELVSLADFEATGAAVMTATDDGSAGHRGVVTDLLQQLLFDDEPSNIRILCCGPEPMMKRVSQIANDHRLRCEISLETPMACGIGICFTCVARIRDQQGGWDYRRTCIEGPVFAAEDVCWTDDDCALGDEPKPRC